MRKIRVFWILSVLLLLVLPRQAASAETAVGGQLTDTITWAYADGTLTISGTGDMGYSTSNGAPWYDLRAQITTVIVEEGIEEISFSAFENCFRVTRVQLPSTLVSIGYDAFFNCQSLTEITLPANLKWIGDHAFHYCISLRSITIPNTVESMGGSTFYDCESLETVILSEKLEQIGPYTFYGCESLRSITLPENIRKIERFAFKDCKSLERAEFSEGLCHIYESAFYGCTALTSLEFPASFRYFKEDVFYGCDNLVELRFLGDIPSVGDGCFNLRKADEAPCKILYPADNETWTAQKMDRLLARFPGQIRFEPHGEIECDHQVVVVPGKTATCTEPGVTEKTYCGKCDKVLKSEMTMDPLGHDFVVTIVEATCTEPGYELHKCSRCQMEERCSGAAATGHSFGPWQTVKEPTCEAEGLSWRVCEVCGESEQHEIEKLTPPTEPSTGPPTQTSTVPSAAPDAGMPDPVLPTPGERIGAGLLIVLILVGVGGAIVAVKMLTQKKA